MSTKLTREQREKVIQAELDLIDYKLKRHETGPHIYYTVWTEKNKVHAQGSLSCMEVVCGLKTAQEYSDETYCKMRSDPYDD